MSNRAQTFSRIEIEASEWLVAMSDKTVSLDERSRFEAWLSADPEHERIYQVQKKAWSAVAHMPHLLERTSAMFSDAEKSAASASDLPLEPSRRGPPALSFALAAALALVAIGLFVIKNPFALFKASSAIETGAAQVKDFKLNDGTRVTLGASSHIDVDLGMSERRIALTRGEAFFEVSRDASRPFFVTAGGTVVRVVGTKFDVNYGTETVRVSVLEGRVELLKASGDHAQATTVRQVLTSGTAAVTDRAGEIVTTRSVNLGDLGVWRQSHLVYVDTRLRDVVADINRYYKGKIELADESTGDLQLTTAFRVDQIDRMIDVLESALPIETTRTADGRIILSQRLPKP
jgi:transmembrane sensor